MKRIIITLNCILFITCIIHAQNKPAAAQNANTTLSNLSSPTSVNVNLVPDKNNNRNLGNSTKAWRNLYLDTAVYLGGYKFLSFKGSVNGGLNTAVGVDALNANTTGWRNTATGFHALYSNTTGIENTATGLYALVGNTTGSQNVAEGVQTMENNTTGTGNTAIGTYSFLFNTIGSYNAVLGYSAGGFGTKVNNMVAVGAFALTYLDDGGGNCTAVGEGAGFSNTTGHNNTYLGFHSGNTVTTGSSNTIIGYGADVGNENYSNATALGNLTIVGGSNHVRIGNSSVTRIGGQVSWSTLSDARVKKNIQQNVPGLQFINLLKPVTYHYDVNKQDNLLGKKTEDWNGKYDIEKIQFTGFVAQDVEAAAKKIGYDFSGVDIPKNDKDFYSLRYSDFVVPLVKAVQELSKMNDEKDSTINNLETRLARIESLINSQQATVSSQQSTAISSASLQQNIPNPFSNSTTINYSLPQHYSSAKIIVVDESGKIIKSVNLSGGGKGNINFSSPFRAGASYQYALYVDGKLVASKQMITSK